MEATEDTNQQLGASESVAPGSDRRTWCSPQIITLGVSGTANGFVPFISEDALSFGSNMNPDCMTIICIPS